MPMFEGPADGHSKGLQQDKEKLGLSEWQFPKLDWMHELQGSLSSSIVSPIDYSLHALQKAPAF